MGARAGVSVTCADLCARGPSCGGEAVRPKAQRSHVRTRLAQPPRAHALHATPSLSARPSHGRGFRQFRNVDPNADDALHTMMHSTLYGLCHVTNFASLVSKIVRRRPTANSTNEVKGAGKGKCPMKLVLLALSVALGHAANTRGTRLLASEDPDHP